MTVTELKARPLVCLESFARRTAIFIRNYALGALLAALGAGPAAATESGLSVYLLGSQGPLAGVLPGPGTYFRNDLHYYDAELSAHVSKVGLDAEAELRVISNHLRLTHVTELRPLGAHWGFGIVVPVAYADASADIRLGPFRDQFADSKLAQGDITITPIILGWHWKAVHVLTGTPVYIPTGQSDVDEDVNIGRNHFAFDPVVGVTWLDPARGHEASVFLGYTINLENPDTDYRSGGEFHADIVLAQHFESGLALGIGGYAYQQVTEDSGSGANFGSFKGRVFALGPQVSYKDVELGGLKINLNARYFKEFGAENRFEGDRFLLSASLRF